MRKFLSLLQRFQRDERGAFLALFGVLAVVLIAISGAVVDYTAMEQARTRAQVALDAAALALQPKIYDSSYDINGKARDLLVDRVGDTRIASTITNVDRDTTNGTLTLTARLTVPMSFVSLIGINTLSVQLTSQATRGSKDVEVSVALDITTSMAGSSRIGSLITATNSLIDLVVKDVQSPTTSKMALVPYSNGVNVGGYADKARGPVTGYTNITAASWLDNGDDFVISAITKANPARVTTTTSHGLSTGDTVYISNVAGGGFTALNGRSFTITRVSSTQFSLNSTSSSSYSGSYTASSGVVTTYTKRAISAISKQNPGRITTAVAHGLSNGDAVYVTEVAGGGFTALNNTCYSVTVNSTTQFSIGISTSTYWGTYTTGTGFIQKARTGECEVVVTSASHGHANGDVVYISNVSGMTQLNGNLYEVSEKTTNTFVLKDSYGPSMSAYTSGGRSYCTKVGCYYYYWPNASSGARLSTISECVTERVASEQYTDAAPSTAYVGRMYPSPGASLGTCPSITIQPLTDDKATLHTLANSLTVSGSTAGQVGLAWAWYMLSPNFLSTTPAGGLGASWPSTSLPEDPAVNRNLIKVVVLMTDGAFNTGFCNGVISRNYGVLGNSDSINCDATNGNPFTQATSLCDAIKNGADGVRGNADDIILYTVAFDVGSDVTATNFLASCATDSAHAYTASNGADLSTVFTEIGTRISALRISQ